MGIGVKLEFERHDWASLRATSDPTRLPFALNVLSTEKNKQALNNAYWGIDNVAVVDGGLFNSAEAVIPCLLSILNACSNEARPFILELLSQLASFYPHPSEIELGNTELGRACMNEISNGVSLYFDILENAQEDEIDHCIDLLEMCCRHNPFLFDRVKWWFERHISVTTDENLKQYLKRLVCVLDREVDRTAVR